MKTEAIIVKEIEPQHVAFVSYTGNYMANSQVFTDLFGKLCGWAGPKGLMTPEVQFISSYQDDPNVTPPEKMTVDVCMVVPEETDVDGEVEKKRLSGGTYAVMRVELAGPQEYGPAWMMVVDWAKQNERCIDMSRPSYEFYLNCPEEHPEKHHILDVCLSIK